MAFIISPYRFAAYDADYQAVLNRATALGYTLPSDAQKTKQNTFVLNLKSAGIWSLLDILYVFATDGDSDYATLNWKAPSSYQITKVNTPTFTTNEGFDFNGTTQYLNTNWAPGTNGVNYTQNNASFGAYINDNISSDGISDIGASNNANGINNAILLNSRQSSGGALGYRINDNVSDTKTISSSIGFIHLKRTASNVKQVFVNGSQLGTNNTTTSTSLTTVNLFLGAANGNGTATRYSTRELSMAFAGSSLDTLESTFYTHWNTYFTGL